MDSMKDRQNNRPQAIATPSICPCSVLNCSRRNSDQYRFCTKVVRLRRVFCTVGICARNFQSRFPLGAAVLVIKLERSPGKDRISEDWQSSRTGPQGLAVAELRIAGQALHETWLRRCAHRVKPATDVHLGVSLTAIMPGSRCVGCF
jgi:hypothetical protein